MKVKCDQCLNIFEKSLKEIKKTKHNFCNHSCSAKFTNFNRKVKSICPKCKGHKDYSSKLCRKCTNLKKFEEVQRSPLSKYILKGNARIKFSPIRKWALIAADYYELSNKCNCCSFSVYTEVCHIKPISSFSENSLMGEVNSKDNLIRLCPNHHIMLDKGLITPAEARTRKPSD